MNSGTKLYTHRYCTCNKSWLLPVVPSVKTQQKCSGIPGNGTKDETEYESSEQENYCQDYTDITKATTYVKSDYSGMMLLHMKLRSKGKRLN
jgi:hypothetical protein